MAAKATPLGKLVLILLIVGALFGGYKLLSNSGVLNSIAPSGKQAGDISPDVFKNGPAGKLNRPLRVGINTWCGFAGGMYYNGSFKANTESEFYKKYGIEVEFIVIDDPNAGKDAWKAGKIDTWYCTIDSFPVDLGGIQSLSPQIFLQTDWSRGGDAIVVRPGISKVADLKGKRIAVATGSPSHTFLLWMLSAGELNYSDVKIIQTSSGIESASYFKAGKVDAAVVWSPDDQDCITALPGSSVLVSTKEARNIIADCLYTKKAFLDKYPDAIKALVEGWLTGNARLNAADANRHEAAKILAAGFNVPEDFAYTGINNARKCTHGDNQNFFGMNASYAGMTGQQLYEKMAPIFARINLAQDNLPGWRQIISTSSLLAAEPEGSQSAEGQATFTRVSADAGENMTAISTKKLTITFPSGSSVVDANAKYIMQMGIADIIKGFSGAHIRIEGNTDNTGNADNNMSLSRARAQAVANYLVANYKLDPARFIIIGNGQNKPIASNDNEDGRSQNRRTDFEIVK